MTRDEEIGLAFMLGFMAVREHSDEAALKDYVLRKVGDPSPRNVGGCMGYMRANDGYGDRLRMARFIIGQVRAEVEDVGDESGRVVLIVGGNVKSAGVGLPTMVRVTVCVGSRPGNVNEAGTLWLRPDEWRTLRDVLIGAATSVEEGTSTGDPPWASPDDGVWRLTFDDGRPAEDGDK